MPRKGGSKGKGGGEKGGRRCCKRGRFDPALRPARGKSSAPPGSSFIARQVMQRGKSAKGYPYKGSGVKRSLGSMATLGT